MSERETAAEARARVEARREEDRAEREERFREAFGDQVPGRWIVRTSLASTAVLAVVTALAAAWPDTFVLVFFVVALGCFVGGCALFIVDVLFAAGRSRTVEIGIGGLFFLAGSAPSSVRTPLLASLAVQVVVVVAGAAVRPFTPLAFGTLAPILGLGWCGLWGARHGVFPPRRDAGPR
ncbi:MAG: hypothetical protein KGR17_04150 [Acidobacteria bacterium]|nr:hypothetical protein [Acidobacteriota bacterium]